MIWMGSPFLLKIEQIFRKIIIIEIGIFYKELNSLSLKPFFKSEIWRRYV